MSAPGALSATTPGHVLSLVADHDGQVGWLQGFCSGHNVTDQGNTGELVQHLCTRRIHSGSLACGQDHHGQRCIAHMFI
jgi:hypothetical protein